jgi:hypothetical protein
MKKAKKNYLIFFLYCMDERKWRMVGLSWNI